MRLPSAWDLIKLCLCAAAFGWRSERAATGDVASSVLAIIFGIYALALAYRIWAMNRITEE